MINAPVFMPLLWPANVCLWPCLGPHCCIAVPLHLKLALVLQRHLESFRGFFLNAPLPPSMARSDKVQYVLTGKLLSAVSHWLSAFLYTHGLPFHLAR
jgi:hypothetical protein